MGEDAYISLVGINIQMRFRNRASVGISCADEEDAGQFRNLLDLSH